MSYSQTTPGLLGWPGHPHLYFCVCFIVNYPLSHVVEAKQGPHSSSVVLCPASTPPLPMVATTPLWFSGASWHPGAPIAPLATGHTCLCSPQLPSLSLPLLASTSLFPRHPPPLGGLFGRCAAGNHCVWHLWCGLGPMRLLVWGPHCFGVHAPAWPCAHVRPANLSSTTVAGTQG